MTKLLLHTCCAPCSIYCIDELRSENIEPTVYWYNPNIHPYKEYEARRDCLKKYASDINVNAIFEEDYGLREFCKNVVSDLDNRCVNYCYKIRLEKAVKYAVEHGYNAFSTTLLVSIYQKHEEIKQICEELSKKYKIDFLYRDFRVGFREGQAKARELGLYMQKYCGCIFSEEGRYLSPNSIKNSDTNDNKTQKNKVFEARKVDKKEQYLSLLLEIKDDKTSIINGFKESDMYILKQGEKIFSVANILYIDDKRIELKNIVTIEEERNKGYASKLIKLLSSNFKSRYNEMIVGADAELIPFFAKLGFDKYIQDIKEDGKLYYTKDLNNKNLFNK